MNDQIKDMWYQAAKVGEDGLWPSQAQFVEKFAELIIEDIVELMRERWYELNNTTNIAEESSRAKAFRVGQKAEITYLVTTVKEHFGIES